MSNFEGIGCIGGNAGIFSQRQKSDKNLGNEGEPPDYWFSYKNIFVVVIMSSQYEICTSFFIVFCKQKLYMYPSFKKSKSRLHTATDQHFYGSVLQLSCENCDVFADKYLYCILLNIQIFYLNTIHLSPT